MVRTTQKMLQAALYLSKKYNKPIYEIINNETSARNVYAELEADGCLWDAASHRWVSTNPPVMPTPEPPRSYVNVALRLMTQSAADMVIAEAAIVDVLHDAGFVFSKEPRTIPNHGGSGMRCYIEIEV